MNASLLRCLKAQGTDERPARVWWELSAESRRHDDDQCARLGASGAGTGPNLLLWTGYCHRPVLEIKEEGE